MAVAKSYFSNKSYRFLSDHNNNSSIVSEPTFEFDESDLWNGNNHTSSEFKKSIPSSRYAKKSMKKIDQSGGGGGIATSLPVNIPDWSKILKTQVDDEIVGRNYDRDDVYVGDEDGDKVPPHEYLLARQLKRTQIACSFSVHEGRGRTLKGRDLSRVRNAIWEKTGFED